jgi:hypothetical protein
MDSERSLIVLEECLYGSAPYSTYNYMLLTYVYHSRASLWIEGLYLGYERMKDRLDSTVLRTEDEIDVFPT